MHMKKIKEKQDKDMGTKLPAGMPSKACSTWQAVVLENSPSYQLSSTTPSSKTPRCLKLPSFCWYWCWCLLMLMLIWWWTTPPTNTISWVLSNTPESPNGEIEYLVQIATWGKYEEKVFRRSIVLENHCQMSAACENHCGLLLHWSSPHPLTFKLRVRVLTGRVIEQSRPFARGGNICCLLSLWITNNQLTSAEPRKESGNCSHWVGCGWLVWGGESELECCVAASKPLHACCCHTLLSLFFS